MAGTKTSLASSLLLLALAPSCMLGGSDYADVLPDQRLMIDLPVDSSGSSARMAGAGEWATYYLLTAEATENVNGFIGDVLGLVESITAMRPTTFDAENHTAIWGPWSDALDPVATQFVVVHAPETDTYTWAFEQWPVNDGADSAVAIVSGEVDAGATQWASSGRFTADFDLAAEMNPTEDIQGFFAVEYALTEDGASAEVRLENVGEDAVDAAYVYDQIEGGEGMMDLLAHGNLEGGDALESLFIRSRWAGDGAGRSDVRATGGDIDVDVIDVSECWDTTFHRVYYTDNMPGSPVVGSESACAFDEASFRPTLD